MATPQTEKWTDVAFGFKFINNYRLQVSNLGNLKAFNKFSPGETLQGSTINGYRIIRLKLYNPKDKTLHAGLKSKHEAILALRGRIKKWILEGEKKNKTQIAEGKTKLKGMQDRLRKARQQDIKDRTNHYHSLVHRLVAEHWLTPKSPKHSVVGHLDYNKMNNAAANLKWMTPEENYKHQAFSPNVIKEKKERLTTYRATPRGAKLSVEQVAALKKSLAEGKSIKSLGKKFKITDTQVMRIKREENWAHVKAAK